jgi:phosphoribosylanthranilate isomerase
MKIKVCGMCQTQNIANVVSLGIDYIGFIFYEKSPRYILQNNPDFTKDLNFGKAQKVGVFVNHSIDFIAEKINQFHLDLVQLHGHESVEFCSALQNKFVGASHRAENTNNGKDGLTEGLTRTIKIIKVFSIGEDFDFRQLDVYKPFVDYFLFDTKGKDLGGNGITFNWELLKKYDNEVPFFLSGGIDIQHVEEIKQLKNLNIHALDINSKFEVSAGLKEVEKVREFKELLGRD